MSWLSWEIYVLKRMCPSKWTIVMVCVLKRYLRMWRQRNKEKDNLSGNGKRIDMHIGRKREKRRQLEKEERDRKGLGLEIHEV